MDFLNLYMVKSGIYIIRCSKSIKVYIGSTIDLNKRKRVHFRLLFKNIHINEKLQNAYNKYSKSNFTFEILELVKDKTKLIEREQFYLDKLVFASEKNNRFIKLAFNICRIADSSLGTKRIKAVRDKISNALKNSAKLKLSNSSKTKRIALSNAVSGKGNGMYGRSAYTIWIEKYGKKEADKREEKRLKKLSVTNTDKGNPMYGRIQSKKSNNKNRLSNKLTWVKKIRSSEYNSIEERIKRSERAKKSYATRRLNQKKINLS